MAYNETIKNVFYGYYSWYYYIIYNIRLNMLYDNFNDK
jgi:hypothetical protein